VVDDVVVVHERVGQVDERLHEICFTRHRNFSSVTTAVGGPRRVADTEMFAYAARGTGFFRASDRTLWAHEHDGVLLSARSGAPLAHRVGNVFYDLESELPLYIEDTHAPAAPAGTPDGIIA
jgi:hypothetical protein